MKNLNCTADKATITQQGTPGWSVDIYRYITYPDGHTITQKETWHYEGYWELKEWNRNGAGVDGTYSKASGCKANDPNN